jgi:hypothetical protein
VGALQHFERRLEEIVQGAFAKIFRGEVQPVEVAGALQRETDNNQQIVGPGRVLVPNDFVVELGEHDFDRLSPYAEPLTAELAAMVREHAAAQRYSFVGPVTVRLEHSDNLSTGVFRVRSSALAGHASPSGGQVEFPASDATATTSQMPRPEHSIVIAAGGNAEAGSPASRDEELVVPLREPTLVVGRGADAALHLDDPGVSRRHAEILLDGDEAVVVDLGSTNGTYVNGLTVGRKQLVDGDRIRVGNTELIYRRRD